MHIETNGCGSNRILGLPWGLIRSATTVDCLQNKVIKSYTYYTSSYYDTNLKGFNGQEKDDEVSGDGNTMSAEFWEYDARLGRRWNLDPIVKPWESGFSVFNNNPIYCIDQDGLQASGNDNPNKKGEIVTGNDCKPILDNHGKLLISSVDEAVVTGKGPTLPSTTDPKVQTDISKLSFGLNATGFGLDIWKETIWKGPYTYKNSQGVTQSVFNTRYGTGRTPANIGNVSRYSKNAQSAIKLTNRVPIAAWGLYGAGVFIDASNIMYSYATNDPNKNIVLLKSSLNITVATYGVLVPGVGWVVSGAYFIIDSTIGWDNAMESMERAQKELERVTGEQLYKGPKF